MLPTCKVSPHRLKAAFLLSGRGDFSDVEVFRDPPELERRSGCGGFRLFFRRSAAGCADGGRGWSVFGFGCFRCGRMGAAMKVKFVTGCHFDKFHILGKSWNNDLKMLSWGLSSLDIYMILTQGGGMAGIFHKFYCDLMAARDALKHDDSEKYADIIDKINVLADSFYCKKRKSGGICPAESQSKEKHIDKACNIAGGAACWCYAWMMCGFIPKIYPSALAFIDKK